MNYSENIEKSHTHSPLIDISFQNLTYSVEVEDSSAKLPFCCRKYDKKYIINNVTGIFKGGEISAIMGVSGCGKTSLLNILSCRIIPESGHIKANSETYNYDSFGNFGNYVMQQDYLMQTLTVRETLEFGANLRMTGDEHDITEKVQKLMKQLKLQKCSEVPVGGKLLKGISGGQKKRTSIAFELISCPKVILLDEPTSGLDSLTSFIIIKYLKKLCQSQKNTIILTIHQPNAQIFNLFDCLVLMVQGRFVYQGKINSAIDYFNRQFKLQCPEFYNPADFLISIVHQADARNVDRYESYFSTYEKQFKDKIKLKIRQCNSSQITFKKNEVEKLQVYKTLIKRNIINTLRHPILIKTRLVQTIFVCIFTGGVYSKFSGDYKETKNWNSLVGFMFFMCIYGFLASLGAVSLTFPAEREVFLKEQNSKLYGVSSYFITRNLIDLPYLLIFPTIVVLLLYWFVGLSVTAGQFFIFYLTYFLLNVAGNSIGYFIGSIILDQKSVNIVQPLFNLPFILFSGLLKNTDSFPDWIGWVQYISPIKYSFTAFVENQVSHTSISNINLLNFNVSLWTAIGMLAVLSLAFRILAFLCLWRIKSRMQ